MGSMWVGRRFEYLGGDFKVLGYTRNWKQNFLWAHDLESEKRVRFVLTLDLRNILNGHATEPLNPVLTEEDVTEKEVALA
jgi:hypothetical protein